VATAEARLNSLLSGTVVMLWKQSDIVHVTVCQPLEWKVFGGVPGRRANVLHHSP
jgi:hypothetical protein